jgi:hypothetical protein
MMLAMTAGMFGLTALPWQNLLSEPRVALVRSIVQTTMVAVRAVKPRKVLATLNIPAERAVAPITAAVLYAAEVVERLARMVLVTLQPVKMAVLETLDTVAQAVIILLPPERKRGQNGVSMVQVVVVSVLSGKAAKTI